jgi:hypothetical protein
VFVSPSAYSLFRRALEAGHLDQAEGFARELPALSLADALELLFLMHAVRDERYSRAATRWLGRVLAERPHVGLGAAAEMADALAGLDGTAPSVARSRLSIHLRQAGLRRASNIAASG